MVIYYLLLLLTDRPIVAPAIDDIIGKERNYGKPIPRQYLFGQTSGDDHVLWIKNDLRRMDIP